MKLFFRTVLALLTLAMPAVSHGAVTQQELQHIVSQLLPFTGHQPQVYVHVDPSRAMGAAAVYGNPQLVNIWVDPRMMAQADRNSWAFILGHELGHPLKGYSGSHRNGELACDEYGARLATQAGYNLQQYLAFMQRNGYSCSPVHGCMHERAAILAQKFGAQPADITDHNGHPPMVGFPRPPHSPVRTSDAHTPQPCLHHGRPCSLGPPTPCVHVTPCQHPVAQVLPCQHPVMGQFGPVPAHPYGDIVQLPAHPNGDVLHPQGDIVPAPFCLTPTLP